MKYVNQRDFRFVFPGVRPLSCFLFIVYHRNRMLCTFIALSLHHMADSPALEQKKKREWKNQNPKT